MYHIAILTNHIETGHLLAKQTQKFCEENGVFPIIELHDDQEVFFNHILKKKPTSVILAFFGVAGLNTAEHLRSLFPDCGLLWCSDLDFSIHAFKLRADYFMLLPPTESNLRQGLSIWINRMKSNHSAFR